MNPRIRRWVHGRRLTLIVAAAAAAASLPIAIGGAASTGPAAVSGPVPGPRRMSPLVLDRATAVEEPWRVFTGHLVHFTWGHLAWNLGTFLALGFLCEPRLRRWIFGLLLGGAALATGAGTLLLDARWALYGGLSGIDSALFAAAVVLLVREARRRCDAAMGAIALAAGVGFLAKVVLEALRGASLFANDLGEAGVRPVPVAHLLGAAIGLAVVGVAGASRKQPNMM